MSDGATIRPWQITRAEYERLVMPQSSLSEEDVKLLRKANEAFGAGSAGGYASVKNVDDLGMSKSETKRLQKLGLVRKYWGGYELTITAMVETSIANGTNPWLGGPVKHHRRIVEEAIQRGEDVPENVLAEHGLKPATG